MSSFSFFDKIYPFDCGWPTSAAKGLNVKNTDDKAENWKENFYCQYK